jgi:hypothetical protein
MPTAHGANQVDLSDRWSAGAACCRLKSVADAISLGIAGIHGDELNRKEAGGRSRGQWRWGHVCRLCVPGAFTRRPGEEQVASPFFMKAYFAVG